MCTPVFAAQLDDGGDVGSVERLHDRERLDGVVEAVVFEAGGVVAGARRARGPGRAPPRQAT